MTHGLLGEEGGTPAIDTTVPHQARVYNYWLGGTVNFPVDREAAERAIAANPGIVQGVRHNRAFLGRAVRYLAGEAGIRQFLDIGAGIPTDSNTHQMAQAVAPDARTVYVDHDPIVLLHAQSLLTSTPEGAAVYLDADLRDVAGILARAAATLDFSRPVAVLLLAMLQVIPDADDPWGLVAQLMAAVPGGSYLVISHPASDIRPAAMAEMQRRLNAGPLNVPVSFRARADVARFFTGLELAEPGLVQTTQWRPDPAAGPPPEDTAWAGLARKPA